MTNEWLEFQAYIKKPTYSAASKHDLSYLGRFTFKTITDFEGCGRILTVIARGYLFHNQDGSLRDGNPYERVEYARKALCAWCSIPDKKENATSEEWQYKSDFRELHEEFPELVTEDGQGWFYRHVHGIADYILSNPNKTSKGAYDNAIAIESGFDKKWRNKVIQFQIPIFSEKTKGAWIVRFDDMIADALELRALKVYPETLPENISKKLSAVPDEVRDKVYYLVAYYLANIDDEIEWVVLPVVSLDAYFGGTTFSKKILSKLPKDIIIRDRTSYGVSRYKVSEKLVYKELQRRKIAKL